jgi:hypothetical protein
VNFDETIIHGTSSYSHSWERRGSVTGRVIKRTLTGILLLLAVSSDGLMFI